jgi:hypothetical protein
LNTKDLHETLHANYIVTSEGALIAPNPTFCSSVNTCHPNPRPNSSSWSSWSSPRRPHCPCPYLRLPVVVIHEHPLSPVRAVARSGGGRCWGRCPCWSSSSFPSSGSWSWSSSCSSSSRRHCVIVAPSSTLLAGARSSSVGVLWSFVRSFPAVFRRRRPSSSSSFVVVVLRRRRPLSCRLVLLVFVVVPRPHPQPSWRRRWRPPVVVVQ